METRRDIQGGACDAAKVHPSFDWFPRLAVPSKGLTAFETGDLTPRAIVRARHAMLADFQDSPAATKASDVLPAANPNECVESPIHPGVVPCISRFPRNRRPVENAVAFDCDGLGAIPAVKRQSRESE